MAHFIAPQSRQSAQQQIVILRPIEPLTQTAARLKQIARENREMVDVIDAGQQHVVERRLVDELDRAKARVGDEFVGVEEARGGVLLQSASDYGDGVFGERTVGLNEGDPLAPCGRRAKVASHGRADVASPA